MSAIEDQDRPAVLVRHAPSVPADVLRQVCAGIEEEGVLHDVAPVHTVDEEVYASVLAESLAHGAALQSRLDTGIGIDGDGGIVVHHAKLPVHHPAYAEQRPNRNASADPHAPPHGRRAGTAAARLVTGLPLPQQQAVRRGRGDELTARCSAML